MTSEEMLQELLYECYEQGIIEEVRENVKLMVCTPSSSLYELYYEAYKKVLNNFAETETKSGGTI
jgi:hypothetical protein